MQVSEFRSVNEIADTFPGIKIKKTKEFIYNKSDFLLYREQLKENGYILLRNLINLTSSYHYYRNVFSPGKVQAAASVVDEYLINNGYMSVEDGKECPIKKEGALLSGFRPITHHEKFL